MMWIRKIIYIQILFFMGTFPLWGQPQLAPEGKFLSRKVKIGETVRYSLKLTHPSNMEVFLPDSSYNFAPFEFVSKAYFPTITRNNLSTDSVVYELTTFELDSVQALALPAFVLKGNDTTVLASEPDRVEIEHTVVSVPDKVQLVENTEHQHVPDQFNYPYLLLGIGALVVTGAVVFYSFGGRIRKAYKLQRLKRQFERFNNDYEKMLARPQNSTTTEQGLGLWKAYMENLRNIPFTSYTSKEIAAVVPNEALLNSLKNLDVAIYANRINEQTQQSLVALREFARNAYNDKVKEVRNA